MPNEQEELEDRFTVSFPTKLTAIIVN